MVGIAVVLNRLERGAGFILLHQTFGKIRCFSQYNKISNLCVGSLISCEVKRKKSYYVFDYVETDFVPLLSEKHDIFFIHNLLKICLEVPFEVVVDDVFYHLISVYKKMHNFSLKEKNMSLLQLFFLLSIFPEDIHLYNMVINRSDLYDERIGNKGLELCWEKYYQQKSALK